MKYHSRQSVVCCAALFLVTMPLVGRTAHNYLALVDAEPQYAGKLCWAAADVLAVNQFYPHCPAPVSPLPANPALFPTSQAWEAGYNLWLYSGISPLPPMSGYLSYCEDGNVLQGLFCNYWGVPDLHGLTFNPGTDSKGLKWETITNEIDGGHPVLFVWDYPENGTDDSSPVGLHELVITGYSDDTGIRRLQIWDPWPVPTTLPDQVPACGPAKDIQVTQDHSRQIDFSTYSDPVSDMGVTAVHAQDQWGLAKDQSGVARVAPTSSGLVLTADEPPRAPLPPTRPFHKLPHPPSQAPVQVSFAEALSAALPQSRQLDLQVSGAAPRSLGTPFPIVGLGFVQLVHAGQDPTRLLAGTTSAILFPVESEGRVVDAFLMLFMDGRWQRGGYANLEITRRLVDMRARYAKVQHVPLESFYMVSVPGEVAFFAAHGQGKQAVLIPVSTDKSIAATAGIAVPAERQLKGLIKGIKRDLGGHPRPGREFVRPAT